MSTRKRTSKPVPGRYGRKPAAKPNRRSQEALDAGRERAMGVLLQEAHPWGRRAGSREHIAWLIHRLRDTGKPIEERRAEHLRQGWIPQRVPAEAQVLPLVHAYVETMPSIPELVRHWREHVIPAYNRVSFDDRLCVDCGAKFGRADGRGSRAEYCSDECSNRARKRGRERVGNGRSAAENAIRKTERAFKRHVEKCSACRGTSGMCATGERMLLNASASSDALNRMTVSHDPTE